MDLRGFAVQPPRRLDNSAQEFCPVFDLSHAFYQILIYQDGSRGAVSIRNRVNCL